MWYANYGETEMPITAFTLWELIRHALTPGIEGSTPLDAKFYTEKKKLSYKIPLKSP